MNSGKSALSGRRLWVWPSTARWCSSRAAPARFSVRPDGRGKPASTVFTDPATYLRTIRTEVPAYDELQDAGPDATAGIQAERVLELGVGTGGTSRRLLDLHPEAE